MHYRVTGLCPGLFSPFYNLPSEELAAMGILRRVAECKPGYPDRIELRDADPGETLLLLHYQHQPADTPFRSGHAIFIREGAMARYDAVDEIPEVMGIRTISLRAFNAAHLMVAADLADPGALEMLIRKFLAKSDVAYLHAHYAKPGCFAATVTRE